MFTYQPYLASENTFCVFHSFKLDAREYYAIIPSPPTAQVLAHLLESS
jgi:hypothetical protein